MDLSRLRFDRADVARAPACFAVLMVGATARQAASPTARAQAGLAVEVALPGRFAPPDGRFGAATAAALARWKEE